MGFPNTSNGTSGEDELEPLQDGVGEEVEEIMEESMSLDEVKEAAGAQASARAEEPEAHIEVTEAEGSWGAIEAKEPERSSGDKDTEGRTGKGPSAGIRVSGVTVVFSPWPSGGRPYLGSISLPVLKYIFLPRLVWLSG